jgi:hypothetical protein
MEAIQATGQPVREGLLYECYRAIGLTEDCSFHHATSDVAGSYTCTEPCLPVIATGQSPNDFETCLPNACLECEANVRGNEYLRWAGRDLYTSGIIAYNEFYQIKAPCSVYQENPIKSQDPYAGAKLADGPIPVATSDIADRFEPSYRLVVNPETCNYDFTFSFKHDPTLPNAGGWDPSLPNGVTRDEFDAVCARGSNATADDGLPYRMRRKYFFQFGDDVKDVTGIFDHMSIDYNPCGHHDEIYFGRPHYDFHMYTVSETWRTIMDCDATVCDPGDCKYDATFQSTESGKAFFEMEQCLEPFPPYIPAEAPVRPGSFNKNMPFGFVTLSHTANPHSGIHSLNAATAQTWNDTQVERWTEPVMFMMSFDNLITVYEPMIPVEFLQGDEDHFFRSPETPPLCPTLIGLPLTYNATYDASTGFTTIQYLGVSPECACEAGLKTEEECAINDAELQRYDATFEKFQTGQDEPADIDQGDFGKFTVAEVEAAFALEPGTLILPGTEEYDCLASNNFWTDYESVPLVLSRILPEVATPRNEFFAELSALGRNLFQYAKDMYYEHVVLGCFYKPVPDEINRILIENGAGACSDSPSSFAGVYVQYFSVAYIDEYTRLLFYGNDADHVNDVQFMTQFALAQVLPEFTLLEGEAFAYQISGPSAGVYEGYADSSIVQDTNFLGNHGKLNVTYYRAELDEACPEDTCGDIIPNQVPNPAAPNAPWPTKILDNQCDWFSCAGLSGCPETTCKGFTPGACAVIVDPKIEDPVPTEAPTSAAGPLSLIGSFVVALFSFAML